MAALQAALPTHSVDVTGHLQLSLRSKDGRQVEAYLGNIYREYQQDPASRQALIDRYVAATVEAASEPAGIKVRNIVPVIKDVGWLRDMKRAVPDGEQVWEEFNSDLVVVYAEDTETGTLYPVPSEFKKAGLDVNALRELAVANLRRRLSAVEIERSSSVSMITTGVGYEPSLLLLEEYWDAAKLGVQGEIVVAVPSREVLIFTGSRSRGGVSRLRQLARQIAAEDPYALTAQLFVFRDGKFQRFER